MVRRHAVAVLCGVIAAVPASEARGDEVARLVLVVGNDRPLGPDQETLRYADDDAVRWYESFEGLADTRIALTRLDEASRIYRQVHPDLEPPTRAALARAVGTLRARATALRSQGAFVELVFVFAGHGGVRDGQPYLALEDGPLGRADLEELLLDGDPADVVHVVVDACSAAGLVESRGPMEGRRAPMPQASFESLAVRYPRAGFVLASSAGGGAFEWSRFGSGVASHLIRSGLSGAADRGPPDGRVTYDELGAFLRAATSGLLPEDYRQDIRVLAPRALPSAALVDLRGADAGGDLHVDREGRYYLRDADGHRIVDLHQGRGTVRVRLPPYSPRFALVRVSHSGRGCTGPGRFQDESCRRDEIAYEVAGGAGLVRVSSLEASQTTVASRGVIEDSIFEQLFAEPYAGVGLEVATDAEPAIADAGPPASTSLAYRGTLGEMQRELSLVHGADLRLEIPLGDRFALAPVLGFGRGRAFPGGADAYLVYQFDVGLDASYRLLRSPLDVLAGLEARYQAQDQFPPGEADRFSSLALGGPFVRARWDVAQGIGIAAWVGGGARLGSVEGEARVRPYGALGVGVAGDF